MKNVIVAGVVALALVGCGAKEEVAAPAACAEGQVESVNDAGEHVCATPAVEAAPAAEAPAAEAPAAEVVAEAAPAEVAK